jgi:hypothetical protein
MPGVVKVRYTHDAMIDCLIQNPMISQGELAAMFGYTEPWVSLVLSSDAIKARMEMRKAELVDPTIRASIEERFRALATKSLEVLQKKLCSPNVSDNLAIQAATLASRSLGLGGNAPPPVQLEPDRLEKLGSRLLALLGTRVSQAERTLNEEIIDTPSRAVSQTSPVGEIRQSGSDGGGSAADGGSSPALTQ